MAALPPSVRQKPRGEAPNPSKIIEVEPWEHKCWATRLFIGVDLLENHVGRPGNGNFAGFQRFDEALKGLASVSRCLSKLALKLAHIACEKQAQHHGTPDIAWIAPGCTQQLIERRRAFLERIRCQKVRVPKV